MRATEGVITGKCARCRHSYWAHDDRLDGNTYCAARPGPSEAMCGCAGYVDQTPEQAREDLLARVREMSRFDEPGSVGNGISSDGVSWYVLKAGLRNVGVDPACGACMEVFFTGVTTNQHEHQTGPLPSASTEAPR